MAKPSTYPWAKLDPEKFESLCFVFLQQNKFANIRRIGGTGDRARDLVAERHLEIMSNRIRVEKWIIQAKRYTSGPPAVRDLQDTFDWAEAHNPHGIIFCFPHKISPATHDWLDAATIKTKRNVELVDLDQLETFLAQHDWVREMFFPTTRPHQIPQVGSIDHWYEWMVEKSSKHPISIYTAGKMSPDAKRGAVAAWRTAVETRAKDVGVSFLHPEFMGCDHTGINAEGTVGLDAYMISRSRLVVGYLNDANMPGTITELMIALTSGKEVAIFVDDAIIHDVENKFESLYEEIYKTHHGCSCILFMGGGESFLYSNPFWFFLLYVKQKYPAVPIIEVNGENFSAEMVEWIEHAASKL